MGNAQSEPSYGACVNFQQDHPTTECCYPDPSGQCSQVCLDDLGSIPECMVAEVEKQRGRKSKEDNQWQFWLLVGIGLFMVGVMCAKRKP